MSRKTCGSSYKEYMTPMNGIPQGSLRQEGRDFCYFPQPAPKRVYCHPAPFTDPLGKDYQRLIDGYGQSTPFQGC